jgi:hypothetical protein
LPWVVSPKLSQSFQEKPKRKFIALNFPHNFPNMQKILLIFQSKSQKTYYISLSEKLITLKLHYYTLLNSLIWLNKQDHSSSQKKEEKKLVIQTNESKRNK